MPAGMNLRELYARTPMITASVPLDANITYKHKIVGHQTLILIYGISVTESNCIFL